MTFFRKKRAFALLAFVVVFLTVIGQIYANSLLLLVAFATFLALMMWAAVQDMILPLLLFFLPWAPILKLEQGTTSIYTLALFAVLGIYMLRIIKNAYVYHLFPALLLIGFTLTVKILQHYPVDNDYILLAIFLVLFPFLSKELKARYDFYILTIWFSFGIVLAALSARQLMVYPGIARYVTVHDYLQYAVRLSGYYGDPNFYAAHISAALAGIMVLLTRESERAKRLLLYALMLLLIYCGFLSVAKSFVLIFVCLVLFWILQILFQRGSVSLKALMLLSIIIGTVFILSSTLFDDLLESIFQRLRSDGGGLVSLTTHRSELWLSYFNAMEKDPSLLWFGRGFTNVLINGRASHNTLLQIVYQTGILGSGIMLLWIVAYAHSVIGGIRIRYSMLMPILILITGAFGPWLGLDALFFDEFFLFPLYVGVGIHYVAAQECDA